ncbi:MAG: hypothetical protein MI864_09010 [Pseudomonadales bacterium]|nr:hypothetical protein [Pseudomonadales bacterium]
MPQQPAFRDFSVLKYAIGTSLPPTKSPIELISGWHELEREHVWSNGLVSVFRIPLPSKHTSPAALRIYGFYFAGAEKTGVYVNNQYLGSFVLGAEKITLPKSSLAGNDLKVELRHTHPTSPKALGMSEDVREFKFGLSRIYLEAGQPSNK